MKGLFVDFYDSFSANLIQCFDSIGLDLEHHYWDEGKLDFTAFDFVVLGPGPGVIDDYVLFDPFLEQAIALNIKVVGFCLGHQILGRRLGLSVKKLDRPFHAKWFNINLSDDFSALKSNINVQFYNSWYLVPCDKPVEDVNYCTVTLKETAMVVALKTDQFISYQFHPESVGTSCPQSIFRNINVFLYNNKNAIDS
jgi:anthranilate/para-aminobenzoate synthase component II